MLKKSTLLNLSKNECDLFEITLKIERFFKLDIGNYNRVRAIISEEWKINRDCQESYSENFQCP